MENDLLCPSCRTSNPSFSDLCFHCHTPIVTAPVTTNAKPTPFAPCEPEWLVLTAASGDYFAVRDSDVVGRNAVGAELLDQHKSVSREHAQFVRNGVGWHVVDLDSSNGTYLDGQKLPPKIPTLLQQGQKLGFAASHTFTITAPVASEKVFTVKEAPPSTERQSLVILFADIKGSVDFFQEMGTLVARSWILNLFKMLTSIISLHEGIHLKNIGDAILAVFPSAREAALAAREMQLAVYEHNKAVTDTERYMIRIGMNLGNVLFENNDIYGNAVNIASRVQDLTPPGRIFITRDLHEAIKKEPDIITNFIGEGILKGVKQRTGIYEISCSLKPDDKDTCQL